MSFYNFILFVLHFVTQGTLNCSAAISVSESFVSPLETRFQTQRVRFSLTSSLRIALATRYHVYPSDTQYSSSWNMTATLDIPSDSIELLSIDIQYLITQHAIPVLRDLRPAPTTRGH